MQLTEIKLQYRQSNFMKPGSNLKSSHEKFAAELRKEKRVFHQNKLRKLNFSENIPNSITNPTEFSVLTETLLTISKSQSLDKEFIKNSRKNIREIMKCTLESLDANSQEVIETSLSILEKISRIEDLLGYLKGPEILIKLLSTLDLGFDSLYSYIINILANLCHEYTEVANFLLKSNYLEQLNSIAFNDSNLVKLTSYALLKLVEKSSKNISHKDMVFVVKIIEFAMKNRENDRLILNIVDFLDDCQSSMIELLDCIQPVLLRNLTNKSNLDCVLNIINTIAFKEIPYYNYINIEMLNLLSIVFIDSIEFKRHIMFIISNFVSESKLNISNFLVSDLKITVLSCINHPSFSLRKECSFVFRNLGTSGAEFQIIEFFRDDIFVKIATAFGVDPAIDENYLIFVSNCLDMETYKSKVLSAYIDSNINDKILKSELSKNERISKLASTVLEKFLTINNN